MITPKQQAEIDEANRRYREDPSNSCGQVVGCYALHLYCGRTSSAHSHDEFPHEITGEDKAEAFRTARARGWLIPRDFAKPPLCPKCSGKRRTA